jgi:hypothetical protein
MSPSAKTFGVRSKKCTLFLGKNLTFSENFEKNRMFNPLLALLSQYFAFLLPLSLIIPPIIDA